MLAHATSSKPSPHAAYFSVRSPIVDQNPGTVRHSASPPAADGPGDLALRERVAPVLDVQRAARDGVAGAAAVPAGQEAVGGGAHRGLREDLVALAEREAGVAGEVAARAHAGREEDEVGVEGGAAGGLDAQRPVRAVVDGGDRRLVAGLDARLVQPGREPRADLGAEPRLLGRGILAEERDRAAPRPERRGGLAADEPRADDDDARARLRLLTERERVVDGPEHAHAVELGAVDRRPDGLGAGGEDARGVRDARPVLERDAAAFRVERRGAAGRSSMPRAAYHEPSARGRSPGSVSPRSRSFESGGRWYGSAALAGEEHDPSRPAGVSVRPGRGVPGGPPPTTSRPTSLMRPPPGRRGGRSQPASSRSA